MLDTPRDIDITTCGLLKSIIESGVSSDKWEGLLIEALKIQNKTTKLLNAQLNKKKEATSNARN